VAQKQLITETPCEISSDFLRHRRFSWRYLVVFVAFIVVGGLETGSVF